MSAINIELVPTYEVSFFPAPQRHTRVMWTRQHPPNALQMA